MLLGSNPKLRRIMSEISKRSTGLFVHIYLEYAYIINVAILFLLKSSSFNFFLLIIIYSLSLVHAKNIVEDGYSWTQNGSPCTSESHQKFKVVPFIPEYKFLTLGDNIKLIQPWGLLIHSLCETSCYIIPVFVFFLFSFPGPQTSSKWTVAQASKILRGDLG